MNQKGLAPLLIVLLITVIGGYFIYTNYPQYRTKPAVLSPTPSASPPTSSDASPAHTGTDETASWKTYTKANYKYTVKYPQDWYVKQWDKDLLLFGRGPEPKEIPPPNHGWADLSIQRWREEFTKEALEKSDIDEGTNESGIKIEKGQTQGGKVFDKLKFEKTNFLGYLANRETTLSPGTYIYFPYTKIIFNAAGTGWIVMYPHLDYEENYDPIYDQILSTLKFQ